MARLFDRNMFIMLLTIMIGALLVTYFFADIVRRTEVESLESQIIEKWTLISQIAFYNPLFY